MSKSKLKNKYYVVIRGRYSGIFDNWQDCRNQVQCYGDNWFQGFPTIKKATDFLMAHKGVTDAESGYLCCLGDQRYDFLSVEELLEFINDI